MAAPTQTDVPDGQDQPPSIERSVDQASADVEVGEEDGEQPVEALVNLTIHLPHEPRTMTILVSPQEQVHEVRQSIIDLPAAFRYTCFHLEHQGKRINDFVPIAEILNLSQNPDVTLVEDPYTEKEARIHLVRIRELIGAAGDRTDVIQGILPGLSLLDTVDPDLESTSSLALESSTLFGAPANISCLLPPSVHESPKTVKTITLSPWNPPPPHLKQRGHLLYLIVTTNEGEQYQITSHVGGFFVNKSANAKFDPFPRPAPKGQSSHSLLGLLQLISPAFETSFRELQGYNNMKDPLATFQIANAIPAAPWAVPPATSSHLLHLSDPTRSQETYLIAGVDNTDTLRDWNEELQSARELPKETVQDRVFRERLISKLFADFNDAATRGAILVAQGEIPPLNPTECKDAQIFVYNNVFFSFGADGVGTFASEGGDQAARVATGKDVAGVRLVNQIDVDGLFTTATVVVDYLGKRIVGQSIVPGIFKPRDPGENQIDYGAVEGKEVIAADERFVSTFEKLSKSLKVKKHAVWDKEGNPVILEASVETKGLLGTDGRKYVLDLYRVTPLDINWLEETSPSGAVAYPHRMTVLRHELVESFYRKKMKEWVDDEMKKRERSSDPSEQEGKIAAEGSADAPEAETQQKNDHIDISKFQFSLNPDVFSGQVPQTDEERAELAVDEEDVRAACNYLTEQLIPEFVRELKDNEASFPMDGQALRQQLHKRGINVRYLGKIASLAAESRLHCLQDVSIQDMIARAFKHAASKYLRNVPAPFASSCMSHLLNCLLGYRLNPHPVAVVEADLRSLYPEFDFSFEGATPEHVRTEVRREVSQRFRYELADGWENAIKPLQLLREISLKLGLQMQARAYTFIGTSTQTASSSADAVEAENGNTNQVNGEGKKKKKGKHREGSPSAAGTKAVMDTFTPDDVINIVPVVKHSAPRSALAEEALEAGRLSIMQGQKKLGQELLLESLSLHEQIYGILHPEVARVYNTLSMMYYQLDEKEAAVELARKAIIVAERTVGVDSTETLLNYLNLSLFLHQTGASRAALAYVKHALELWKIIYGADHPDSITTINNGAVMLQHLKAYRESRLWFEESLRICNNVFGDDSINAATLLFQLAQALALDGDHKNAVSKMKTSFKIFKDKLGPEDKNTKEAESWLDHLTRNAVNKARIDAIRDAQSKQVRMPLKEPVLAPLASTASSQPDTRSIEDILRYIEGDSKQSSQTSKGPNRRNPKRRGKA